MTLLRNVLDAAVPHDGALPPHAPRWQRAFAALSEALRYPALWQATLTAAGWWLALFPVLYRCQKGAKAKRAFLAWNTRPFLVNVHGLNLPLAAAAHLLSPRRLTPRDLWIALAGTYLYLLFYLRHLDRNGLHFYIIFTPRTRWAPVVYASVIGLGYGMWRGWDALSARVLEATAGESWC